MRQGSFICCRLLIHLKQLTREYLNDLNRQRRKRGQVALEFGDGDVNHGGAGLTVVKL